MTPWCWMAGRERRKANVLEALAIIIRTTRKGRKRHCRDDDMTRRWGTLFRAVYSGAWMWFTWLPNCIPFFGFASLSHFHSSAFVGVAIWIPTRAQQSMDGWDVSNAKSQMIPVRMWRLCLCSMCCCLVTGRDTRNRNKSAYGGLWCREGRQGTRQGVELILLWGMRCFIGLDLGLDYWR